MPDMIDRNERAAPVHCAAAKVLKAREAELPGTVVLLFQPAEEGPGGAAVMIGEHSG